MPVITNQYTNPGAKPTIRGMNTAIASVEYGFAIPNFLSEISYLNPSFSCRFANDREL